MGIPETVNSLVLRTDFSDDKTWAAICAAIEKPVEGFQANVDFVNDPAYKDTTAAQLLSLLPQGSNRTFAFIVDNKSFLDPDHPILVVDFFTEPGRTFRIIPSAIWMVENNLSIANMDFAEFADAAGADGIFRGFD